MGDMSVFRRFILFHWGLRKSKGWLKGGTVSLSIFFKFSESLILEEKKLHSFFHLLGATAQSLFFHSRLHRRVHFTHQLHNHTLCSDFTLLQAFTPPPMTQQKGVPVTSLMNLHVDKSKGPFAALIFLNLSAALGTANS